jgi:hypothetical protein
VRRRAFILALGGAAAWPLAARAQQPAMPVSGFFSVSLRPWRKTTTVRGPAGDVEGQNVVIECRWAETQYDRLSGDCRQVPQVGLDLRYQPVDTVKDPFFTPPSARPNAAN